MWINLTLGCWHCLMFERQEKCKNELKFERERMVVLMRIHGLMFIRIKVIKMNLLGLFWMLQVYSLLVYFHVTNSFFEVEKVLYKVIRYLFYVCILLLCHLLLIAVVTNNNFSCNLSVKNKKIH